MWKTLWMSTGCERWQKNAGQDREDVEEGKRACERENEFQRDDGGQGGARESRVPEWLLFDKRMQNELPNGC